MLFENTLNSQILGSEKTEIGQFYVNYDSNGKTCFNLETRIGIFVVEYICRIVAYLDKTVLVFYYTVCTLLYQITEFWIIWHVRVKVVRI
jgi:hypothetical protein